MRAPALLTVDAIINLVLGALLLVFPSGLVAALGIPESRPAFYPSLLGSVLVGIGIALLIERLQGTAGLGLEGAVSINLCGGAVLAGWLLFGSLSLPTRGQVFLWALVVVLVGVSALELVALVRGASRAT